MVCTCELDDVRFAGCDVVMNIGPCYQPDGPWLPCPVIAVILAHFFFFESIYMHLGVENST